MATPHSNLLKRVLTTLSVEGFKVWQNDTGIARSLDGERIIHYGREGSTDILGTAPNGLSTYIEIKIPPDTLKPNQIIFRDVMIKQGAIYSKITPENFNVEIERISREGKARLARELQDWKD